VNEGEILECAPERIQQCRTAEVKLCFVDEGGETLPNTQLSRYG
jgi:hypothetical protein